MNVLIFGANGQLGRELKRSYGAAAECLGSKDCDLRDAGRIAGTILAINPDVIVNAAGYTDVDKAESEPNECRAINVEAVNVMADVANELDCPLVQISSDYVFGGIDDAHPYDEEHPVMPLGVYARSKADSEYAAMSAKKHLVVRTCGLYGRPTLPLAKGRSILDTIIARAEESDTLDVVDDQWCTPTYAPDLARAIEYLVNQRATGLFHATNGGVTNWFEFAKYALTWLESDVEVRPISTEEYSAPAPRPSFSALNTEKYHDYGGPRMSHWQEALKCYLQQLKKLRQQVLECKPRSSNHVPTPPLVPGGKR